MNSIRAILEELVSKCWISEDGKIFNIQNKLEIDKALISIAKIVEGIKDNIPHHCEWNVNCLICHWNFTLNHIAKLIRGESKG